MWPKRPASVVIDSAMYLLTISWPDIDNVAMSLYDITLQFLVYFLHTNTYIISGDVEHFSNSCSTVDYNNETMLWCNKTIIIWSNRTTKVNAVIESLADDFYFCLSDRCSWLRLQVSVVMLSISRTTVDCSGTTFRPRRSSSGARTENRIYIQYVRRCHYGGKFVVSKWIN